jgi:hypothetical protein
MTKDEALDQIKMIMGNTDCRINDLRELLVWAYEKGWADGIEYYREDQDPTECQEWRNTR